MVLIDSPITCYALEYIGLYGSEAFVNDWLLPFLQQNYGADFKKMKPYGFVVMDVPMFFNTQPYSQAIIAPAGYGMEKQVNITLCMPDSVIGTICF